MMFFFGFFHLFHFPTPSVVVRKHDLAQTTPDTTDSSSQLDILLHDGDALRVDGAQVRVFEQVDEERLCRFLQGLDGMRLPAQLGAHVRGEDLQRNLAHQSREGELRDEEVVGALVFADFLQGDGAGLVATAAALRGGVAGCEGVLI